MKSYLQPKFTKVNSECVNDSQKKRLVECMWLILQNIIAFYRTRTFFTLFVRYSGRERMGRTLMLSAIHAVFQLYWITKIVAVLLLNMAERLI